MDENEILVGELRKYLRNTPQPTGPESEHVLQLKRELNLAARVGQQILMQLKATEKAKEVSELEIARLKSQNAQLIHDNQKLAREQDLLAASIEQQDAELSMLTNQLQSARRRTEQMTRAMASARALEREVEILTDLYANLRQELVDSNMQREEAEKLAKKLAANLSKRLQPAFNELTANTPSSDLSNFELDEISAHEPVPEHSTPTKPVKLHPTLSFKFPLNDTPSDIPSNTPSDIPCDIPKDTPRTTLSPDTPSSNSEPPAVHSTPHNETSTDSLHIPNMSLPSLIEDLSLDETESHNHSSTDLSLLGDGDLSSVYWMHPNRPASPRPRLARSQSHESVFSTTPNETASMLRPLRMDNLGSAKQTLAAVNGEHYGEPVKLVRHGARDKLSAMRGAPDRRRWGFFLH